MSEENKRVSVELPGDIVSVLDEYYACIGVRDSATKMTFGYRKAKRAAIESEVARRKFWKMCHEIFPESKTADADYDRQTNRLSWPAAKA